MFLKLPITRCLNFIHLHLRFSNLMLKFQLHFNFMNQTSVHHHFIFNSLTTIPQPTQPFNLSSNPHRPTLLTLSHPSPSPRHPLTHSTRHPVLTLQPNQILSLISLLSISLPLPLTDSPLEINISWMPHDLPSEDSPVTINLHQLPHPPIKPIIKTHSGSVHWRTVQPVTLIAAPPTSASVATAPTVISSELLPHLAFHPISSTSTLIRYRMQVHTWIKVKAKRLPWPIM